MRDDFREKDFELKEVKEFEEASGRFRNLGQWLMCVIVLAGLSGILGYAPWTKKEETTRNGITVEYDRIVHAKRDNPITLRVHPASDSVIDVLVNTEYLEYASLKSVQPEPLYMAVGPDGTRFHFKRLQRGQGLIRFNFYPARSGRPKINLLCNGELITIEQLIYP